MAKVFDKGYEMTSPHNCGKFFNEVTIEELRKIPLTLTEEERITGTEKPEGSRYLPGCGEGVL